MNTIYRIECQDGHGPYRGHGQLNCYTPDSHNRSTPKTPSVWDDGIGSVSSLEEDFDCMVEDILFGFASLDQLDSWFEREAREAIQTNARRKGREYRITVYEAPSEAVKHGGKQLVFNMRKARRVAALDLVSTLPLDLSVPKVDLKIDDIAY